MTEIAFALLAAAAALLTYTLVRGPTLVNRVIGLNGIVLVGMAAIAVHSVHADTGAFLPTIVAVALVGPIGTGMIARFIEGSRQ